ncbi:MAG: divergent polysaccharide deacetylase family protein [Shewanella sp.]
MRLLPMLTLLTLAAAPCYGAKIALIIDDLGYRHTDNTALELPSAVTLSVLPLAPHSEQLAQAGLASGHEIMLHLPMQALNGKALGPLGLTETMNKAQVQAAVFAAIASIPCARGVNNHMGSLLTQLDEPMRWVMESLKQKQLYFVDSRTTQQTKAGELAEQLGVRVLRRQLFLDNDISDAALERQFTQMMAKALAQGQLVAIAHPYPETIRFLKVNLIRLAAAGIELVPVSNLLPIALTDDLEANLTARQE